MAEPCDVSKMSIIVNSDLDDTEDVQTSRMKSIENSWNSPCLRDINWKRGRYLPLRSNKWRVADIVSEQKLVKLKGNLKTYSASNTVMQA